MNISCCSASGPYREIRPEAGLIDPPRYRTAGRVRSALVPEVTVRIDHYLELNAGLQANVYISTPEDYN